MMWQSRMEYPWIQDTGRGQKKPTENQNYQQYGSNQENKKPG